MSNHKYKAIKIDGTKHDYHRWIMEQKIGRKLDYNEIVHHINEDKSDNRIDNLEIISRAEHARLHHKGRRLSAAVIEQKSIQMKGKPNRACRKLNNEQAMYIRKHYIPGDKEYGARALARRFNICHSCISNIINNKRYVNPT